MGICPRVGLYPERHSTTGDLEGLLYRVPFCMVLLDRGAGMGMVVIATC